MNKTNSLFIRPAQFFSRKMPQTPRGTLGQKVSAHQFLSNSATLDHAAEAPEIPILRLFWLEWSASEPQPRGPAFPKFDKNWCALTFWPKVLPGVLGIFTNKFGLA